MEAVRRGKGCSSNRSHRGYAGQIVEVRREVPTLGPALQVFVLEQQVTLCMRQLLQRIVWYVRQAAPGGAEQLHLRGNKSGRCNFRCIDRLTQENEAIHAQIGRGKKTVRNLRENREYWRHRAENLEQRISRALEPLQCNAPDHCEPGHSRRRSRDE